MYNQIRSKYIYKKRYPLVIKKNEGIETPNNMLIFGIPEFLHLLATPVLGFNYHITMSEESELQLMSGKSLERTKQRSDIAKKQKLLIDELVDLRVKMQSILVLVNKLPQVVVLFFHQYRELFEMNL